VESYFADWKTEQNQYDRESNHGLDQEKQLVWEAKIARQLQELGSFAFSLDARH
jgi:hypothetical protein